MTERLLSFAEALDQASDYGDERHVLLGNGFSIDCRPGIFTYKALLDEAKFVGCSVDARAVFQRLGTTDFERVIEALQLAGKLIPLYATSDPDLARRLGDDSRVVRDALASVLADNHPEHPFDLTDEECASARRFLSKFKRIYTVNYDLLLYWVLRREGHPTIKDDDGFRWPGYDADYVTWDWYTTSTQTIFYLHGALHLYEQDYEVCKYTWSKTGVRLVDQIRDALADGKLPLVVSEGVSKAKLTKMLHSSYLAFSIRRFATVSGSLFIFGHSLAPNDEHITSRIVKGRTKALFVSLHGDPDSTPNSLIKSRATALAAQRVETRPLDVFFFGSESAEVWRPAS